MNIELLVKSKELTIDADIFSYHGTNLEKENLSLLKNSINDIKNCFDVEVVFKFKSNSYNLSEIKKYATGGGLAPMFQIKIDDCIFNVIAFGALNDTDNIITCFMIRD